MFMRGFIVFCLGLFSAVVAHAQNQMDALSFSNPYIISSETAQKPSSVTRNAVAQNPVPAAAPVAKVVRANPAGVPAQPMIEGMPEFPSVATVQPAPQNMAQPAFQNQPQIAFQNRPQIMNTQQVMQPMPQTMPVADVLNPNDGRLQNQSPAVPTFKTVNSGNFYAGLGIGVIVPGDIQTDNGILKSDIDASYLIKAGYRFNQWLTAEAEFIYSSFNISSLSPQGSFGRDIAGLEKFGYSLSSSGSVSDYAFLANAIISPVKYGKFKPYFGGGLGIVDHSFDWRFTIADSKGNSALESSYKNSDVAFAVNGIAGVDYTLGNNFEIGLRYQYLWADTGKRILGALNSAASPDSLEVKSSHSNLITANAYYNF